MQLIDPIVSRNSDRGRGDYPGPHPNESNC
jgi:hypothetical protein